MRRLFVATPLLLAATLCSPLAQAVDAPEPQAFALEVEQREATRFVRQATGRLVIAPDGSPTDITLEAGEPHIAALYRRIIGAWRFEPVQRDGVAVATPVDMSLTLSADRIEGTTRRMRYGIADVDFFDGTEAREGVPEHGAVVLKPPTFPMNMARAGVGARLLVLLEVDSTGRVTRAAIADATLYARHASSSRAAAAQIERFAEVTLAVVDEWVVANDDVLAAGWALVPVHFVMPGATSNDWTPILPMTASSLPWMAQPMAEAQALNDAGRPVDERIRLRTPLASN